jgi:hypothetical protein
VVVQPCHERELLIREYHQAAKKIYEAGLGIADMTSSKWMEATSATRQASKAALNRLNQHRKENGC